MEWFNTSEPWLIVSVLVFIGLVAPAAWEDIKKLRCQKRGPR